MRSFSFSLLFLLFACSGQNEDEHDELPKINLPKIEFQNYNERISYCIGLDHGKETANLYNGKNTAGKFDLSSLSAGMTDYLSDNTLRIPMENVDSLLDLYLPPGGEVDENAVPKSDASYAIGLSEGQFLVETFVSQGIDQVIEVWFLVEGIKAGMSGDESVVTFVEAAMEVIKYFNDITMKMGESFLRNNGQRDSVTTTPSGLQYQIINEGKGIIPNMTDSVTVHYTGYFIDGTAFESTIPSGQPQTFIPLGLIPGWQEALTIMKEGSKYRLYIPHRLAYGEEGSGPIPPFTTLVFDIELIKVKRFK